MRNVFRCAVGAASMVALATACSGGGGGGGGGVQKLGVGGAVFTVGSSNYELLYLPGVSVSLTDADGDAETAVTGSGGLFEFSDVREGNYIITFSQAGYESVTFYVAVSAIIAENNVPAIFAFGISDSDDDVNELEHTPSYIFLGEIFLRELPPVVTVVPFDLTLEDGDTAIDGFGVDAVYDVSADGDVLITMDRPVVTFGSVQIRDNQTQATYPATLDATRTVFTISGASLAALTTNPEPRHALIMTGVQTFSPINGSADFYDTNLLFRAVP